MAHNYGKLLTDHILDIFSVRFLGIMETQISFIFPEGVGNETSL